LQRQIILKYEKFYIENDYRFKKLLQNYEKEKILKVNKRINKYKIKKKLLA